MYRRILIVVEPSAVAAAAIDEGLALARVGDAEVVFLGGLPRHLAPAAELPDAEMAAHWKSLDDAKARTQGVLAEASARADELGVMSRTVFASGEDGVRGILDSARALRCDLIVVASEGSNAVVRLLTGSVIPGLITASSVPLLVCAPVHRPAGGPAGAVLRRIMVVLEDKDGGQPALDQGLDLAQACGAELLLVHIVPPEAVPMVDISSFTVESGERLAAEMRERSQRLLAAASLAAGRAGVAARSMSLPAGCTSRDVARLADEQGCDLIVLATEERNAVLRLLSGCLVPGLITAAAVPVLVCRDAEQAAAREGPRRRRRRRRAAAAAGSARGGPA